LRILRGDRDTIADVSESWQEYVTIMAFFSRPFTLHTYKDVQQLYDDAMEHGFTIDSTLPSEVASAALFTGDLPRVIPIESRLNNVRRLSISSKPISRWLYMFQIYSPRVAFSMNSKTGESLVKYFVLRNIARL
jgi:predicted solute-binding protein